MIDIHSHILPELDDGAGSLQESLEMGQLAVADGIRIMVATPHVISGLYDHSRATILAAVAHLKQTFADRGIPLEILPGAEYRLEPDLPQRLCRGELMTINDGGRYLLVELPADLVPNCTGQVLYELQLKGVTPIIAHPERNLVLARRPAQLHYLVRHGALAQITGDSVTGLLGAQAATAAKTFLRQGCVHLLASDAHNSSQRTPTLAASREKAAQLVGQEEAANLVQGNPQRVINSQMVTPGDIKDKSRQGGSLLARLKQYFLK